MVRVNAVRGRYATGHRHSSSRSRGRDATRRASSEADAWLALLLLCGLLVVVGLVIALVLLVLFAAVVALSVWGAIKLVQWLRQRQRSAAAVATSTVAEADANNIGLITHLQVLGTFPAELRDAFDRPPGEQPIATRKSV